MTREEEIEKAAQKNEWISKSLNLKSAFTEGAEWADKNPQGVAIEDSQEKMVSLDKVCDMLYAMLTTQDINDYDYVTAPAYDNVGDFVYDFRKAIDE